MMGFFFKRAFSFLAVNFESALRFLHGFAAAAKVALLKVGKLVGFANMRRTQQAAAATVPLKN